MNEYVQQQRKQTKIFEEYVTPYKELTEEAKELIKAANDARQYAYAPYSNFKVGAAFLTKCGRIYSGCNVENAVLSPALCAERTALCKAISEGYMEFIAGACVAYQTNQFTAPCGVCRQFIMEFASQDIYIYIMQAVSSDNTENAISKSIENREVLCTSIYNLLPFGFRTYKE